MKKVVGTILSLIICLFLLSGCITKDPSGDLDASKTPSDNSNISNITPNTTPSTPSTPNTPNTPSSSVGDNEPRLISLIGGSVSGTNVAYSVTKNVENLALFSLITVSDNTIWKVIDVENNVIANKVVKLVGGNNIFFIEVSLPDGTKAKTYTLTINRAQDITVYYMYYDKYNMKRCLDTVEIEPGTLFKADYVPKINGFTFNYWEYNGKKFEKGVLKHSTYLYANTTILKYKLHFIIDNEEWQTIEVEYGDWIHLPTPEKEHYHFDYWNDSGSIYYPNGDYRCYGYTDRNINGSFDPNHYKITYEFGEIAHNRREFSYAAYGKQFKLYELNYSYTKYNGTIYYLTGYTYNGEPFESGEYWYDGDITVQAVWTPESEYNQNN